MRFREETEQVRTIQVGEQVNVDLAPDGTIYGIELLNANLQLGGLGKLVLENEATGSKTKVALPK